MIISDMNLENINYLYLSNEYNKDTIVILHGWWWSLNSWEKVAEKLSIKWYNVLVPDLPWFWKTQLSEIYNLNKYTEWMISLLKELSLDNFILLWHSNWWAIATKLENTKEFNIKKLVLNNSAWLRNNKKSIKKIAIKYISKILKPIFNLKYLNKIRGYIYRFIWWHDYLNTENKPFLKETYLNIINEDITNSIKNISTETLLIRWGKDTYTPLSDWIIFNKLIKKSNLIILKNESHWIHLKNPNLLVETFLKNI